MLFIHHIDGVLNPTRQQADWLYVLDCSLVHIAESWRLWVSLLTAKRFESDFVPAEVDRSSASDFIEKHAQNNSSPPSLFFSNCVCNREDNSQMNAQTCILRYPIMFAILLVA